MKDFLVLTQTNRTISKHFPWKVTIHSMFCSVEFGARQRRQGGIRKKDFRNKWCFSFAILCSLNNFIRFFDAVSKV